MKKLSQKEALDMVFACDELMNKFGSKTVLSISEQCIIKEISTTLFLGTNFQERHTEAWIKVLKEEIEEKCRSIKKSQDDL